MIYHICSIFFFETFLGFNWFILEALLEMKKKNNKNATKCSQYNMIITIIDKFQKLNFL